MTASRLQERARWLARNMLPHERGLRAWLASNRGLRLEVDDIVQETYAIIAALDSVAHIQNPRNYMYQTARSVILRQVRRDRVVSFETVSDIDKLGATAREPSPEEQTAQRQELRTAAGLLATLPERARQAFLLRRVQGYSQREIASRMGISENTVEKHIGKALSLLMQAVATGGGNPGAQVSTPRTPSLDDGEDIILNGSGGRRAAESSGE